MGEGARRAGEGAGVVHPVDSTVSAAADRGLCAWLGELADAAWKVIADGRRLAQEHVGREVVEQVGGSGLGHGLTRLAGQTCDQ